MNLLFNIANVSMDKIKRSNDKSNSRPICLSKICSKILEVELVKIINTFLQSSSNQFGFKPKHGTKLCVFAFKELLRFFIKHGSAMPATRFCPARVFFFLRLFRAVPGSGRFQLTNLLGYS